jgi:hypothetical protein
VGLLYCSYTVYTVHFEKSFVICENLSAIDGRSWGGIDEVNSVRLRSHQGEMVPINAGASVRHLRLGAAWSIPDRSR